MAFDRAFLAKRRSSPKAIPDEPARAWRERQMARRYRAAPTGSGILPRARPVGPARCRRFGFDPSSTGRRRQLAPRAGDLFVARGHHRLGPYCDATAGTRTGLLARHWRGVPGICGTAAPSCILLARFTRRLNAWPTGTLPPFFPSWLALGDEDAALEAGVKRCATFNHRRYSPA